MAHHFGTRDEVKDATQDIWFFQLDVTDRKLGGNIRVVGAVLPLEKAEIVPVPKVIDVELKPRYKALIAVCLCSWLVGAGAFALLANNTTEANESIAYSVNRKGTPRPQGATNNGN